MPFESEVTTATVDETSMFRINALAFALEYHQNREGTPEEVVRTANKFFDYLDEG